MAQDPAFLFYPGDYLRDTQCLSEAVQVAYDRIMCEHMRKICISQDQLDFFTKRLSAEEKKELSMVLEKIDGGYHIPWVSLSIEKRREYSDSRRKNRSSSKKEEPQQQEINPISEIHILTHVEDMENEIEIVNESKEEKGSKKKKAANPFPNETEEIILFLNECTGKDYRTDAQKNIDPIVARLKEGYTVEQFKHVVRVKTAQWLKKEDMKAFLRPETLFGNKFEGYRCEEFTSKEQTKMDTLGKSVEAALKRQGIK